MFRHFATSLPACNATATILPPCSNVAWFAAVFCCFASGLQSHATAATTESSPCSNSSNTTIWSTTVSCCLQPYATTATTEFLSCSDSNSSNTTIWSATVFCCFAARLQPYATTTTTEPSPCNSSNSSIFWPSSVLCHSATKSLISCSSTGPLPVVVQTNTVFYTSYDRCFRCGFSHCFCRHCRGLLPHAAVVGFPSSGDASFTGQCLPKW